MKQLKAYKFRMYPSVLQKELINKTIGCTRLVYNIMLGKKKDNNNLSKFDLMSEMPSLIEEYPFLSEVDSMSLRCAITDLNNDLKDIIVKRVDIQTLRKKDVKKHIELI